MNLNTEDCPLKRALKAKGTHLLDGERRQDLLPSQEHGSLRQGVRELRGVQPQQLRGPAQGWR